MWAFLSLPDFIPLAFSLLLFILLSSSCWKFKCLRDNNFPKLVQLVYWDVLIETWINWNVILHESLVSFQLVHRVRRLRFHGDHGSPLRDILLRVSVLGVFAYALFSLISGTVLGLSLDIPALLVAGTAALVILQVRVKKYILFILSNITIFIFTLYSISISYQVLKAIDIKILVFSSYQSLV